MLVSKYGVPLYSESFEANWTFDEQNCECTLLAKYNGQAGAWYLTLIYLDLKLAEAEKQKYLDEL